METKGQRKLKLMISYEKYILKKYILYMVFVNSIRSTSPNLIYLIAI